MLLPAVAPALHHKMPVWSPWPPLLPVVASSVPMVPLLLVPVWLPWPVVGVVVAPVVVPADLVAVVSLVAVVVPVGDKYMDNRDNRNNSSWCKLRA